MGGSCSTMINSGVTWRMTSTWESTALTSAALLHVRVLVTCSWVARSHFQFYYPQLSFCFKCVTFLFVLLHCPLRPEPTGGKDTWCPAPDCVQRRAGDQPVCRQCRRCSVRQNLYAESLHHTDLRFILVFVKRNIQSLCVWAWGCSYIHIFSLYCCRAWTMALQDARINMVRLSAVFIGMQLSFLARFLEASFVLFNICRWLLLLKLAFHRKLWRLLLLPTPNTLTHR